ncbi:MAG: hypothetical protein QNI94_12005, partial [Kiloniellales bacterium]|nr:hypothetical protein [Kiloniellales bacterium]
AWLGGPTRNYHTYIHEDPFTWSEMAGEAARLNMAERSHVLLETDGTCFRVVEVQEAGDAGWTPPGVRETGEGHGTRWICKGA